MAALGVMPRVLLSTGTLNYRFTLDELARIALESGLDGLEVVMNPRAVETAVEQGSRWAAGLAVPVVSLHAPYQRTRRWGKQAPSLLKTIALARQRGIERVVFHPTALGAFEPSHALFLWKTRDFQQLGGGEVLVSIENLPCHPGHRLPFSITHPGFLRKFLERRNLYFTLDTSHFASCGHTWETAMDVLGEFMTSVHLTNASTHDAHEHLAPHLGCLGLDEFMRAFPANGHDVVLVLEIDFGLLAREHIRQTLVESVAFVREHLHAC